MRNLVKFSSRTLRTWTALAGLGIGACALGLTGCESDDSTPIPPAVTDASVDHTAPKDSGGGSEAATDDGGAGGAEAAAPEAGSGDGAATDATADH